MSVTDAPFTNPALPPSMHQTEQQRQHDVAAMRNDVYRSGIEGPFPPERADRVPWIGLVLLAIFTAYALGQRTAEVRIGELTAPLEARIATLEAQNTLAHNRLTAMDAQLEERIDSAARMIAAERTK